MPPQPCDALPAHCYAALIVAAYTYEVADELEWADEQAKSTAKDAADVLGQWFMSKGFNTRQQVWNDIINQGDPCGLLDRKLTDNEIEVLKSIEKEVKERHKKSQERRAAGEGRLEQEGAGGGGGGEGQEGPRTSSEQFQPPFNPIICLYSTSSPSFVLYSMSSSSSIYSGINQRLTTQLFVVSGL